jgi:Holliday junction resolvase RusA-like endonuclease
MSIKSEKARDYERAAMKQIPKSARVALTGPVRVTLRIFYASERPDLDESVVLDVLQSKYHNVRRNGGKPVRECIYRGVYINDRQVRQKFVMHGIDRANPRTEVRIEPLEAQQSMLEFDDVPFDVFGDRVSV